MNGTTIDYANGSAPAGWLKAGLASVADAPEPAGPIHLAWAEDDGSHYSADIPMKPGYILKPEGILVLQVLPERTVSAHPVLQKDCWAPPFYQVVDVYPSVKILPGSADSPAQPGNRQFDLASARSALKKMFQGSQDILLNRAAAELDKSPIESGSSVALGGCQIDLNDHSWRLILANSAARFIYSGTFQLNKNLNWEAVTVSRSEQHFAEGRSGR